jgi:hypothetical protein
MCNCIVRCGEQVINNSAVYRQGDEIATVYSEPDYAASGKRAQFCAGVVEPTTAEDDYPLIVSRVAIFADELVAPQVIRLTVLKCADTCYELAENVCIAECVQWSTKEAICISAIEYKVEREPLTNDKSNASMQIHVNDYISRCTHIRFRRMPNIPPTRRITLTSTRSVEQPGRLRG